jgi:hypothetical protein
MRGLCYDSGPSHFLINNAFLIFTCPLLKRKRPPNCWWPRKWRKTAPLAEKTHRTAIGVFDPGQSALLRTNSLAPAHRIKMIGTPIAI